MNIPSQTTSVLYLIAEVHIRLTRIQQAMEDGCELILMVVGAHSDRCSLPVAAEAVHLGSLIAAQGYFFPISDHVLALKDDGTFFRFQVSKS